MSLQISLSSIFSQEEILKHEEKMLTGKMTSLKAQNHQFAILKGERVRIIRLIDERLFKAVDIKKHLIEEISNQEKNNEEQKHLKKKCSHRLTELLIKKEEMMNQKEKEEKQKKEKEENNDDK